MARQGTTRTLILFRGQHPDVSAVSSAQQSGDVGKDGGVGDGDCELLALTGFDQPGGEFFTAIGFLTCWLAACAGKLAIGHLDRKAAALRLLCLARGMTLLNAP